MMANKPLALVTGGASGMGLATVERLARDGFRLALIDRDRALADKETARLHALGLDVASHVLDLTNKTPRPPAGAGPGCRLPCAGPARRGRRARAGPGAAADPGLGEQRRRLRRAPVPSSQPRRLPPRLRDHPHRRCHA